MTLTSKDLVLDWEQSVLNAAQRVRPYIRETPLDHAFAVSQLTHCQVFWKLENLQNTGSFKVRGALNKLLSLTEQERSRGVIAASSGNHGTAVAYGLKVLNAAGLIVVPENVSATKLEAIQTFGIEVRRWGTDSAETEQYARTYAEQHGHIYLSPYNDRDVIAGQGTIGVELVRQLNSIDAVFVSVGGGGLIAGIAGYLKSVVPGVKVIGCSPQNSPVMAESVKANRIVDIPSLPTLSDGTAGGIEPGAITFDLCKALVDEFVLVSESEIQNAMRLFMQTQHQLLEGAAGVAIASFLKVHEQFRHQTVAVVICGANISLNTLKTIL